MKKYIIIGLLAACLLGTSMHAQMMISLEDAESSSSHTGIFASTAFTLVVIPIMYWLLYRKNPPGGVQQPSTGSEL